MKKIVFVIITLAAVLLSSCSVETEGPLIADPIAAEPIAVPQAPTIDLADVSRTAYLSVAGPEIPSASRAELLDFADLTCRTLADGTPELLTVRVVDIHRDALDETTSATVVGSAIGSGYCDNTWNR